MPSACCGVSIFLAISHVKWEGCGVVRLLNSLLVLTFNKSKGLLGCVHLIGHKCQGKTVWFWQPCEIILPSNDTEPRATLVMHLLYFHGGESWNEYFLNWPRHAVWHLRAILKKICAIAFHKVCGRRLCWVRVNPKLKLKTLWNLKVI